MLDFLLRKDSDLEEIETDDTVAVSDDPLVDDATFADEGKLELSVYETDENYVVLAHLGGVSIADLEVYATEEAIIIRGQRPQPVLRGFLQELVSECAWGRFSRTVILPESAKLSQMTAKLKHGLLKLVIPKYETLTRVSVTN